MNNSHLVSMKIGLCYYMSRFSWRQNRIREELFDEICVMSLQKFDKLSVHMLVNILENFIHFTLLFSDFLQVSIERMVEI